MVFACSTFTILCTSLPGQAQPGTAIAASRVGHVGLIDLEYAAPTAPATGQAIADLAQRAHGHWGLKLRACDVATVLAAAASNLATMDTALIVAVEATELAPVIARLRAAAPQVRVLVELTDAHLLAAVEAAGADGIVAKGHEAGGRVGDETTFLLVQRLVTATTLPVIAHGGVGPNTAAALQVAGAVGVLLDWQLALFEEATTPATLARAVARMDGSETRVLGSDLGHGHRVFWRADHKPAQTLAALDGPDLNDAEGDAR